MASTSHAFVRPALPDIPFGHPALLTTSPRATPTYASSALSFSVISRMHIAAPPSLVARVVLEANNWGAWNTFIPFIAITSRSGDDAYPEGLVVGEGALRRGDHFTMHVNMSGAPLGSLSPDAIAKLTTSLETVSVISALDPLTEGGRKGYRICWALDGGFGGLLRAERVQECVEAADGGCEWVTWEGFGGWLAPVVRLATGGKLVERFGDWGRDLKTRCEEVVGKGEVAQEE